jgi:hypothetical protein
LHFSGKGFRPPCKNAILEGSRLEAEISKQLCYTTGNVFVNGLFGMHRKSCAAFYAGL